jgi:hypothetical protein
MGGIIVTNIVNWLRVDFLIGFVNKKEKLDLQKVYENSVKSISKMNIRLNVENVLRNLRT